MLQLKNLKPLKASEVKDDHKAVTSSNRDAPTNISSVTGLGLHFAK